MNSAEYPDHVFEPPQLPDLIEGEWVPTTALPARWLDDPNTGDPLQQMVESNAPSVDRAIDVADRIHISGSWERLDPNERAEMLEHVADNLEKRAYEIALCDSMNTGVPISHTIEFARAIVPRFRAAAQDVREYKRTTRLAAGGREVRMHKLPWGPAVIISPWNAPAFIAASKVASALAAGCPVILKPSEWAPWSAQYIAEAIHETDIPAGAFQLVHGTGAVGARLTGDPRTRVISFTGGQVAGRAIAEAAAKDFKALQLELGGNNPVVVRADADVELTAKALRHGLTVLNGQWCEGPGKLMVHRSALKPLTEALFEELKSVDVGHSLDNDSAMGPLSHQPHLGLLKSRIERLRGLGAQIVAPSALPDLGGWFLSPTLAIGADPSQANDELFGPVLSLHSVDSDEEALHWANTPASGLDAYVFGEDIDAALALGSRIIAGEIRVNGAQLADLAEGSAQSFWGPSGIGGHGPLESVNVFSGTRIVGVDDPASFG